jgi:hypothetical protein
VPGSGEYAFTTGYIETQRKTKATVNRAGFDPVQTEILHERLFLFLLTTERWRPYSALNPCCAELLSGQTLLEQAGSRQAEIQHRC